MASTLCHFVYKYDQYSLHLKANNSHHSIQKLSPPTSISSLSIKTTTLFVSPFFAQSLKAFTPQCNYSDNPFQPSFNTYFSQDVSGKCDKI